MAFSRRWLKIGAGAGAGVVSLIGFFTLLTVLYNFEIVDTTGDISCVGTYADPCMSEFYVKNPNAFVVDIYSKDQVKLDFSPDIYDYALFTKDGRCTATGKCACELKDGRLLGFAGWRCVDFTNKTKPRSDKVYNFRFPAYSTKYFLLAGIKNNPNDKIKWGIGVSGKAEAYMDPLWLPQEKIDSVKIETGNFGGKQITQIETDENYPCYLQSSGKVICPAIKPDKLDNLRTQIGDKLNSKLPTPALEQLEKLIDDELSKGIPKTDLRKSKFIFNKTEKWVDEFGVEWTINISTFDGFEETYLNYSVEQTFDLDISLDGKVRVGFNSNVWEITDFSYGSADDVTAKSYGVALENTHADSDASLVGHWQFTDDATDSSGNGNDGTVTGATHNFSWYDFDGSGDYIHATLFSEINRSKNWTFSAWIKKLTFVNRKSIFQNSQSGSERIGMNCYNGIVRFGTYNGSDWVSNSGAINDNEWYHVLGVYESGIANLYINAINQTGTDTVYTTDENTKFILGALGSSYIESWIGSIDEVAIYNRSLNSTEILSLYNKGLFKHQGNYTSGILDAGQIVNWTNINWTYSNKTANQNVSLSVRTGDTYYNVSAGESENGTWSNWTSELLISQGETLDLPINRFLQYKAKLQTNTSETPILTEVVAEYGDPEISVNFGVNISSMTFNPTHLNDQDVWAVNQTNAIGLFNITNIGGSTADTIGIKLNDTKTGWRMECNNQVSGNWITLNTTYQTIYTNLVIDGEFQTWCRIDLNYPSENWNAQVLFNITS